MNRRSTRWYRKNEKDVGSLLGLKATKGSGSGWVEKEDLYNEKIICQLKSTDKESIKINKLDIEKLEYHSIVEHKIPVFAIQFIGKEVYVLIKPNDIPMISQYLETGIIKQKEDIVVKDIKQKDIKTIKSNRKERKKFFEEKENYYKKKNEKKHLI